MKNYFIIIALTTLFIFSCGKREEMKTSSPAKDTVSSQKQVSETKTDMNNQKINDDGTVSTSSLTNIEYGISKLPPTLKGYKGEIIAMAKWEDKLGANVLFVTETKEISDGGNLSKELYAYHYTITDKENGLIWKINDFIKDCPVDVTLSYIPKSLSITDLDNNSIAESTFLYRMACKGDVSPDDMKLMMHEGETKYAIRGQMKLKMNNETYGGEMKVDESFNKAPKEFVEYAKERWGKFQTEKIQTN